MCNDMNYNKIGYDIYVFIFHFQHPYLLRFQFLFSKTIYCKFFLFCLSRYFHLFFIIIYSSIYFSVRLKSWRVIKYNLYNLIFFYYYPSWFSSLKCMCCVCVWVWVFSSISYLFIFSSCTFVGCCIEAKYDKKENKIFVCLEIVSQFHIFFLFIFHRMIIIDWKLLPFQHGSHEMNTFRVEK